MKFKFESIEVGCEIPSLTKKVTLLQLMMYSAATWNLYRLHWDTEFSRGLGFKDANIHGPLFGAFLSQMLVDWIGDVGALKRLNYSVRIMCFPNETLACKGKVLGKHVESGTGSIDCEIWVENKNGEKVCTGQATMIMPTG